MFVLKFQTHIMNLSLKDISKKKKSIFKLSLILSCVTLLLDQLYDLILEMCFHFQVQHGQYYRDLLQSIALLGGKICQEPFSSTIQTLFHPQKDISKQLFATPRTTRTPQQTLTCTTSLGTILQNNTQEH